MKNPNDIEKEPEWGNVTVGVFRIWTGTGWLVRDTVAGAGYFVPDPQMKWQ